MTRVDINDNNQSSNIVDLILGSLVYQLPGVVTFAYDLCFRSMIDRWKGVIKEIHFGGSIIPLDII